MKQWVNTIAGVVLFSFACILYFLVPSQVAMIEVQRLSMSPAFYPRLVVAAMAVLALIYLLSSFFKEKKGTKNNPGSKELDVAHNEIAILGKNPLRILTTAAILLGYIYLLEFTGFLIATPVGLGAFMFHMGNRRIKVFCLGMIIVPLVFYYFFQKVMLVILPTGTLFY